MKRSLDVGFFGGWLPRVGPELLLVLGLRHLGHVLVDLARDRVGPQRPAEQQDVRLRPVDGVVRSAAALLDPHSPPFCFRQKAVLRELLRQLLGQDHVPVCLLYTSPSPRDS